MQSAFRSARQDPACCGHRACRSATGALTKREHAHARPQMVMAYVWLVNRYRLVRAATHSAGFVALALRAIAPRTRLPVDAGLRDTTADMLLICIVLRGASGKACNGFRECADRNTNGRSTTGNSSAMRKQRIRVHLLLRAAAYRALPSGGLRGTDMLSTGVATREFAKFESARPCASTHPRTRTHTVTLRYIQSL